MSAPAVQTPRFVQSLPPLELSVLRVLLYFDLFDYPLTAEEIFSFLPSREHSLVGFSQMLRSDSLKRIVLSKGRFFFLPSASESCVDERLSRERFARRRLRIAAIVARFISLFPFVQAVMLSGELSKGIATRDSDVDFAIVTRAHRLWICRTILILFKKVFLFNNKKYFCLNHFISEEDLAVEMRNIYSATEIATLIPLWNRELHAEYLRANQWIGEFFPNWNLGTRGNADGRNALNDFEPPVERRRTTQILDRIDLWLMIRWRRLWQKRYAHLTEMERRHKFCCETSISTAYGEDYQQKILTQYSLRLRQYGIPGPEQRN